MIRVVSIFSPPSTSESTSVAPVSERGPLGSSSLSKQLLPSELSLLLSDRGRDERLRRWRRGIPTRSVDAYDSVREDEKGSEAEWEETTIVIIKSSQSPQEVDEIVS